MDEIVLREFELQQADDIAIENYCNEVLGSSTELDRFKYTVVEFKKHKETEKK
jgi:menaquinone-dependent protoporphyrinogen IX oxidase